VRSSREELDSGRKASDGGECFDPRRMIKALGWLLLAVSTFSLLLFLYAAFIIRLLPAPSKEGSPLLAAIREDQYYHLLVPVTVPVAVVAVYLNWFSINLFSHS